MLWNMFVNVQAVDVLKKGTLRITRWPSVMRRTYVNHVPLLSSHDSFGLSILTPLSVFMRRDASAHRPKRGSSNAAIATIRRIWSALRICSKWGEQIACVRLWLCQAFWKRPSWQHNTQEPKEWSEGLRNLQVDLWLQGSWDVCRWQRLICLTLTTFCFSDLNIRDINGRHKFRM